jgi:hypothetical protein
MARLDTVRRIAILPYLRGTYGKAGRVGNMPLARLPLPQGEGELILSAGRSPAMPSRMAILAADR